MGVERGRAPIIEGEPSQAKKARKKKKICDFVKKII